MDKHDHKPEAKASKAEFKRLEKRVDALMELIRELPDFDKAIKQRSDKIAAKYIEKGKIQSEMYKLELELEKLGI